MPVIFFDDDKTNIDDIQKNIPNVECFQIDVSRPNDMSVSLRESVGSLSEIALDPGNKFWYPSLPEFDGNSYVRVCNLRRNGEPIYHNNDPAYGFMINNGITEDNEYTLREWVKEHSESPNKIAVFDWDRTISVIEGILFEPYGHNWDELGIKVEDVAVYLMGGRERMDRMQNMFRYLQSNYVTILVLSSDNRRCQRPSRFFESHFYRMMDVILCVIPNFEHDQLICAGDRLKSVALIDSRKYQYALKHKETWMDWICRGGICRSRNRKMEFGKRRSARKGSKSKKTSKTSKKSKSKKSKSKSKKSKSKKSKSKKSKSKKSKKSKKSIRTTKIKK